MNITFDAINSGLSVDAHTMSQSASDYTSKKQRSRRGCMTCKARKKKCDERRPCCSTCTRLKKKCVWIDPNHMTKEEILYIKESVQERERTHKLRNRRTRVFSGSPLQHKKPDAWPTYFLPQLSELGANSPSYIHLQAPEPSVYCYSVLPPDQLSSDSDQVSKIPLLPHFRHGFVEPEEAVLCLKDSNDDDDDKDALTVVAHQSSPDLQQLLASPQFSSFLDSFDKSGIEWPNPVSPMSGQFPEIDATRTCLDFLMHRDPDILNPLPPPQPSLLPILTNPAWQFLYQFYVTTLSDRISVLPTSKNSTNWFRSIFLPLANQDMGVLYSILAWLAFSLGEEWVDHGSKLVVLALDHVKSTLVNVPSPSSSERHVPMPVLSKLASFIILLSAKICHGDVKEWLVYLKWAARIISMHGGIRKFLLLREEMWLVSNFAYHDFLLSGCATTRGTLFLEEDYACVLRSQPGVCNGQMNPLLGVSKEMYHIIGKVNSLIFFSRRRFARQSDSLSTESTLQEIIYLCQHLDEEITNAKPDAEHLSHMTPEERWQHVSLFRVFQLSARLHLMQSIKKCNPTMLEIQLLNRELIDCLDSLLGTAVQPLLVFPIFISAIHCCTNEQRTAMRSRISRYITLYAPWNVRNVLYIVERIWEMNPTGDRHIDWHQVLEDMGWELNFA